MSEITLKEIESLTKEENYMRGYRDAKSDLSKESWISVKDKLPDENGEYLCVVAYSFAKGYTVRILGFHSNLKQLDKYDFPKRKKGFYEYDSEWGYTDYSSAVLYWMPLPNLPQVLIDNEKEKNKE